MNKLFTIFFFTVLITGCSQKDDLRVKLEQMIINEEERIAITELTDFKWDKLEWYWNDSQGALSKQVNRFEFYLNNEVVYEVDYGHDLNFRVQCLDNCGCVDYKDRYPMSECFLPSTAVFKSELGKYDIYTLTTIEKKDEKTIY